jgi:hypothetical protein
MDGSLFGPGLITGTSKPFMLMDHAGHTRENLVADPFFTGEQGWLHLTGWKRGVMVAETLHYDFSDYPILFETLGVTPGNKVGEGPILVGTLKGTSALQEGPVTLFPEVTFEY